MPCEWGPTREWNCALPRTGGEDGNVKLFAKAFPYLTQAPVLTVAGRLASGIAADEKQIVDYFRRASHENEFLARDVLRTFC